MGNSTYGMTLYTLGCAPDDDRSRTETLYIPNRS